MQITCWGARGSIPVSGKEYLKYGGDTTCLEFRSNNGEIIIIDAGSGIRRLGNRLTEDGVTDHYIIFTHAHWDHILGFPFFRPIYSKFVSIKILGAVMAQESIKRILSKMMLPPNFPVKFEDIQAEISFIGASPDRFLIKDVSIMPIALSHPNKGRGFKFEESGKSFVFLTDNELTYKHPGGLGYEEYLEFCMGADLLIHDAQYTSEDYVTTRTWGHSAYLDALNLAIKAGVKRFGLFHHDQERTDDEIDMMVEDCMKVVKAKGSAVECFAVAQDMKITI